MSKPNLITYNQDNLDLGPSSIETGPAGKHGFCKVVGEGFQFEDGTDVVFWSTNVGAAAIYLTSDAEIIAHAKRIAGLGFNLIRLMSVDNYFIHTYPNIFGYNRTSSTEIDPVYMAKFDLWFSELKKNGIYMHFDFHVQREMEAEDCCRYRDETWNDTKGLYAVKTYNYVNPSIQALMKRFNKQFLTHINSYTGLAYKDDPAFALFKIENENDITTHFAAKLNDNVDAPEHKTLNDALATDFAAATGFDLTEMLKYWNDGEPKVFANHIEHQFYALMKEHFDTLIPDRPIANDSSWGKIKSNGQLARNNGSFCDVHSYTQTSVTNNPHNELEDQNIHIYKTAQSRSVGKPITITEWAGDANYGLIHMAAVAAFQEWNAPMYFQYAQSEIYEGRAHKTFNFFNNVRLLAMMPVASLLFREKHVAPALGSYVLDWSWEDSFNSKNNNENCETIRTAVEQKKFYVNFPTVDELPWYTRPNNPTGATIITNPHQNLNASTVDVTSDTGELYRNWDIGYYTVSTDKSKLIFGKHNGNARSVTGLETTISNDQALVSVQSLDGLSTQTSDSLFIALLSTVTVAASDGDPWLSSEVTGTIIITAKSDLVLYSLTPTGEIAVNESIYSYASGKYTIIMDAANFTSHWYFLK